jgi:hypothetical protein
MQYIIRQNDSFKNNRLSGLDPESPHQKNTFLDPIMYIMSALILRLLCFLAAK